MDAKQRYAIDALGYVVTRIAKIDSRVRECIVGGHEETALVLFRELEQHKRILADKWRSLQSALAHVDALEAALIDAAISLDSYDTSSGVGNGADEAVDIARLLGFEDNATDAVEWLHARRQKLAPKEPA